KRYAKLFGNQLSLRGDDALAEFFLAGICRDAAIGGDGDPRIDLIERGRARGSALENLSVDRDDIGGKSEHAETDDERSRLLHEIAARKSGAIQGSLRV